MPGFAATASSRSTGRHHRALAWGLVASVGFHALVVLLWRSETGPLPATVAAGPRAFDAAAAPGGGALEVVHVAPPRAIEVPPPPSAAPALDAPDVVELVLHDARLAGGARLASLAPVGADGRGLGDGGADAQGRFRVTAPEPRVIVPQWNPPRDVKGLEVMVRVLVDAGGRPTGAVELLPRTPNSGFNDRIVDMVLKMEYKPAYRHGRPVAAWAEMTFTF